MNEKNRRKVSGYLVNKELQFRLIAQSVIYYSIITMLTIGLLQTPSLMTMFGSQDIHQEYEAAQSFLLITSRLVPVAAAVLALFLVHQILVIHRLCGPLVNFFKTFEAVKTGNFMRKVVLRKGDYLCKEQDAINEMMEGLSGKIEKSRQGVRMAMDYIGKAEQRFQTDGSSEEIRKILSDLKTVLQVPLESMNSFRLSGESAGEGNQGAGKSFCR